MYSENMWEPMKTLVPVKEGFIIEYIKLYFQRICQSFCALIFDSGSPFPLLELRMQMPRCVWYKSTTILVIQFKTKLKRILILTDAKRIFSVVRNFFKRSITNIFRYKI